MPIHVDLNTPVVPASREVFVVRPGKSYRLFPDFIENEVVAAELPGLSLRDGVPLADHKNLDQQIRRSRAVRSWYRRGAKDDEPSRKLEDYADGHADKSVGTLRTVLTGFFEKLKVDDLVLVPPSAYSQGAYIGRVVSPPTEYTKITGRAYGKETLVGRRVKWLGKIEKRRLPAEILSALEHPTSIYLLARSLRPLIYATAFGSYVDLSGPEPQFTARFFVSEQKFSASSDLLLQAFFNYVAANAKASSEGTAPKKFLETIFADPGAFAPELRTNVNSPGFLELASKMATPLVAAVLFTLATAVGDAAPKLAAEGKIIIGNSQAPAGDQCTALVIDATMAELQLLALTDWPQSCEAARMAADKAGVTGTIRVEQKQ